MKKRPKALERWHEMMKTGDSSILEELLAEEVVFNYLESNVTADTIADGLKTELGDVTFPLLQKYVDRIIRVTEEEIVMAMRLIWERMKLVVEPSAAVALAALLKEKHLFKDKKTGIILSGGNLDLNKLPF